MVDGTHTMEQIEELRSEAEALPIDSEDRIVRSHAAQRWREIMHTLTEHCRAALATAAEPDLRAPPLTTIHPLVQRLLDSGFSPTTLQEALIALENADEAPPEPRMSDTEYGTLMADKLVRGVGDENQRAMTAGCLIAISLHRLAERYVPEVE